jgi:hypothetical protein
MTNGDPGGAVFFFRERTIANGDPRGRRFLFKGRKNDSLQMVADGFCGRNR